VALLMCLPKIFHSSQSGFLVTQAFSFSLPDFRCVVSASIQNLSISGLLTGAFSFFIIITEVIRFLFLCYSNRGNNSSALPFANLDEGNSADHGVISEASAGGYVPPIPGRPGARSVDSGMRLAATPIEAYEIPSRDSQRFMLTRRSSASQSSLLDQKESERS
jgi:hypothetical protein